MIVGAFCPNLLHPPPRHLHDDGLDGVGGAPAAGRHQLHAQRAAVQHVSAVQHGVHHAHEGWVEGKRVLQGRGVDALDSVTLMATRLYLSKRLELDNGATLSPLP